MNCHHYKIVVFDLDETLGYFVELGIFWFGLEEYLKYIQSNVKLDQPLFNQVLDLFPEFQRPNITAILEYLKEKKQNNVCNKLMIYTNNQGPPYWTEFIQKYYEHKIQFPLFDQVVAAFKINGKKIEIGRTSHLKSHKDLIKCTKIPSHTEICFVDDTFFPDMIHDNVYYINVKPYKHDLPIETMISRFIHSRILSSCITNPIQFREFMTTFIKQYQYQYTFIPKSEKEVYIDKQISKKIMEHLRIFFNKSNPITFKQKKKISNKTCKIRK